MRLDLHVHSSYSNDGEVEPEDMVKYAKKINLNGIAITDHNEIKGSLRALRNHKGNKNFLIIPGMEVTSNQGHILALGIKELVPRDLTPYETIERIENLGGVAIAPHPYRFWSGLGEMNIKSSKFNVIEVMNSRSLKKENKKAKRLAEELKCGKTGGSDCHSLMHLGKAYTEFDSSTYNVDDALEQIRKKKTRGSGTHRKSTETPKYAASCVYLWLKRGMKRM